MSLVRHAGAAAGNPGLSAGSIRTGLTTAIDTDQDKPNKNGTALPCSNGHRQNNDSTDDDDDDDDYGHEYTCIGNEPPCNLTSNLSSERCISINKLLEEQHHKWWWTTYEKETTSSATNGSSRPPSSAGSPEMWQGRDGYNFEAFNQTNGVWPLGHPLPLPDWASAQDDDSPKGILHFDSVWQYEDLIAIIETKLQRMLEETHYDTIHLFNAFYEAFKRTRRSDLKSFYQFYDIPINRRHHMCVSLAMEIMARIVELFPVLQHYLYIVSCEEQVASLAEYIETAEEVGGLNSPHANVEKEHAMVAMKISISGREGFLILDPGYHVGRCVTIMKDQNYPNTGWFTQSKEAHIQRDYCYSYSKYSPKYVEWKEREIRGDETNYKSSLVYVEQPYVTAIDVTVRRNLVYNFRSLLSRDAKGRVYAGIYLPLVPNTNEAHFTLFYEGSNSEQRVKAKFMFNIFKHPNKIPENVYQHLENMAPQLNMPIKELSKLLISLAEAVMDQDFIQQVLTINDDIGNMSTN
uniref:Uncharacterized protein n=1 Tax=Stomoxys calcitrans TaxID=35570 RepID=A0A1I8P0V7_STOCA